MSEAVSEDEGTPMEGPLPLELQQIRADTQREEAALAAAKAALAAQRRRSEVSDLFVVAWSLNIHTILLDVKKMFDVQPSN